MYYTSRPTFLLALLYLFLFVACDEICDCDPKPCMFSYGKVSFTPSLGEEQIVSPTFTQGDADGTFNASPTGLAIDENTGDIDINDSKYDQEYIITYTLEDGETTCTTSIVITAPEPVMTECVLDYGRLLFIPGQDVIIAPVSPKANEIKGEFTSQPNGLDLDPETGIINVQTSEPGLVYEVSYVSEDGLTTCNTEIIIAGIDYPDVVIDFSDPDQSDLIQPIINRDNPDLAATIEYDPQGLVTQQGLAFEEVSDDVPTGTINLRQTFLNLEALEVVIEDGFSREFEIPYIYRGGDAVVEGSIPIIIYWFEDEIPEDLLELLGRKQQEANNGRIMHRHSIMVGKKTYK